MSVKQVFEASMIGVNEGIEGALQKLSPESLDLLKSAGQALGHGETPNPSNLKSNNNTPSLKR